MPGIPQVTKTGPRTYKPGEAIAGGQVIEARTGGVVGVAAAGSVKVLGVAIADAIAPGSQATTPSIVNGRPLLVATGLPTVVAVAYSGTEVAVTYNAAAAFGDALIAAANGQVTPAGATPDARAIVGRCSAPAGVAAGAVGLMRTA